MLKRCTLGPKCLLTIYFLQGRQEPDGHGSVRLHQRPPGHRAEPTRRHGVPRLRPHVLQPRVPALAGPQGRHQEAEVRED